MVQEQALSKALRCFFPGNFKPKTNRDQKIRLRLAQDGLPGLRSSERRDQRQNKRQPSLTASPSAIPLERKRKRGGADAHGVAYKHSDCDSGDKREIARGGHGMHELGGSSIGAHQSELRSCKTGSDTQTFGERHASGTRQCKPQSNSGTNTMCRCSTSLSAQWFKPVT